MMDFEEMGISLDELFETLGVENLASVDLDKAVVAFGRSLETRREENFIIVLLGRAYLYFVFLSLDGITRHACFGLELTSVTVVK